MKGAVPIEEARLREAKAKGETHSQADQPIFGLQAERLITTGDANRDGAVAFRFKDDLVIRLPDTLTSNWRSLATRGFTPELKQWMRDNQADILFHFGEKSYDVLTLDLRDGFFGQPTSWNTLRPEQAFPALAKLEALNTNPGPSVSSGCGYRDGLLDVQVFRTRDGTTGYYQLRGTDDLDGRGVELRYKVVLETTAPLTAAPAKAVTSVTGPTFGPVVERVLPSGVPCREQFFQFHNGEVFLVGNGPGTSKDEADYDEKKIEEAGGADMSAGSSDEGISIMGRGCIFTRDVAGLKWDGFTADQVVQTLKYASYLEGHVEPRKQDLPITYLFKTARGEVGLMEIIGVVGDKRDGWLEKGMKFRYKLVQSAGTGGAAAVKSSLPLGPMTNGLQAALEVTPGDPFKLRIYVCNVSDHGIAIDGASYRQEDDLLLTGCARPSRAGHESDARHQDRDEGRLLRRGAGRSVRERRIEFSRS